MALGPVFRGGNDHPQPYFSAPHREVPSPHLTHSNFVSDVGKYRRAGGSNTPDDLEHSLRRGRVSLDNVTQRETKRPSVRPRDLEYHRRFSVGASTSQVSCLISPNLIRKWVVRWLLLLSSVGKMMPLSPISLHLTVQRILVFASSEFARRVRLWPLANLRFDFGFRLERPCATISAFAPSEFALRFRLSPRANLRFDFGFSPIANLRFDFGFRL